MITFLHKKVLYAQELSNRLVYLLETLQECISGQDNVSRTIMVAFASLVPELFPLNCVFMLILCNLHSCTLLN